MTTVRWLSPAPTVTATRLAERLGLPLAAEHGRLEIVLANALIEIAADAGGGSRHDGPERLVVIEAPSPVSEPSQASEGRPTGLTLVAVGITTVDAERFASDRGLDGTPLQADRVLGAACWFVASKPPIVLLEPNTEGRVAASLARFGEGPAALYLASTGRATWTAHRSAATGPFGREYAVTGWPRWGPHVVVCEFAQPPPGTIDP